MLVQQFQGVPLAGIMRGGQDDTTTSTLHHHSQFCGRRRGQVDIYHVPAHTHQGTYYDVLHHLAREARIAAYDDLVAIQLARFSYQGSVSRCEFHDVKRVQTLACLAADGAPDSRD